MRKYLRILLSLLLTLILLPTALAAPAITDLGTLLLQTQQTLTTLTATVEDLTAQYERDDTDPLIQDQLLDALIAYEDAAQALTDAQSTHQTLLQTHPDLETLDLTHDGKYADLAISVTLDGDMTIYDLAVTVTGSKRDQAVAENDFLYQFIGKTLPLTMGNGKKDDVRPGDGAQTTAQDLLDTLNALLYAADEPQGPITDPQGIADYIFRHGELPDNFITKKEAQALGWDSSYNYVGDVAPGKSIGGDRFGNYEGLLPSKKGRTWYEADCYYEGRKRNAHRILYSNDGLVYYTDDHYESFTQMFPSWE